MTKFLTKHGVSLKAICLLLMIIIPFLLYFAALGGQSALLHILLAMIGAVMALTMKVG